MKNETTITVSNKIPIDDGSGLIVLTEKELNKIKLICWFIGFIFGSLWVVALIK